MPEVLNRVVPEWVVKRINGRAYDHDESRLISLIKAGTNAFGTFNSTRKHYESWPNVEVQQKDLSAKELLEAPQAAEISVSHASEAGLIVTHFINHPETGRTMRILVFLVEAPKERWPYSRF